MKTGFAVGVHVTGSKAPTPLGILVLRPNPPHGWKELCYMGEGFYCVHWEGSERDRIVHEDELKLANMRFVITNMKGDLRVLTLSGQGRDTFATRAEAEEKMRILEPGLRAKVLGSRADTLEVTEVECWEGYNDPKRTVW